MDGRKCEAAVGSRGAACSAGGTASGEPGADGAGRNGVLLQVAAMPGVSGEWRVCGIQDGNAGSDPGGEEASGDDSGGAVRGGAGKRRPPSYAKAKGSMGVPHVQ